MKRSAIVLCFALLAACAAPVISDINDSALKIQVGAAISEAQVLQQARQGCAVYDKQPVPISYRCLDGYCTQKEYLFACKAEPVAQSTATATASAAKERPGLFDGKWVGEGTDDGCGLPWAMEVSVTNRKASGLLWRGKASYNFLGTLDPDGRLSKVLAGKTEASNGIVGPRFITVNATFQDEVAQGDYSMPMANIETCVVSFKLSRHQA